jgi:hypothetical protein
VPPRRPTPRAPPLFPRPPTQTRREHATSDASRAAHREALLKQAGPNAGAVPEGALQAALDMQMVESIPLLANTPQTGFVGVNMCAPRGSAARPGAEGLCLERGLRGRA